jgi:hypothetical protein
MPRAAAALPTICPCPVPCAGARGDVWREGRPRSRRLLLWCGALGAVQTGAALEQDQPLPGGQSCCWLVDASVRLKPAGWAVLIVLDCLQFSAPA